MAFVASLTFLPSMSTDNVAYNILKQFLYNLVQRKETDESAWHNLRMPELVSSDSGQTHIQQIFIPLQSISTPRRGRIMELITFPELNPINQQKRDSSKRFRASSWSILWRPGTVNSDSREEPSKDGKFWFCSAQLHDIYRVCQKAAKPKCSTYLNGYSNTASFCTQLSIKEPTCYCKIFRTVFFTAKTHHTHWQTTSIGHRSHLIANAQQRCLHYMELYFNSRSMALKNTMISWQRSIFVLLVIKAKQLYGR